MMMAEVPVSQKRRNDGFFHLKCQDVDGNRDAELQGKRMKGACRSASTPRERKDKVGERIAALQQLVSPFGKTDTASVLLEATGYIRFLHEQLEVLSAPYLKAPSPSPSKEISGVSSNPHSLRSRGLCLVPVAYSQQLGSSNGADIWTPNTNSSK